MDMELEKYIFQLMVQEKGRDSIQQKLIIDEFYKYSENVN